APDAGRTSPPRAGRSCHAVAPLPWLSGPARYVRLAVGGVDVQAGRLPGFPDDQADVGGSRLEFRGGWGLDLGRQYCRHCRGIVGMLGLQRARPLPSLTALWWTAGGGDWGFGVDSPGLWRAGVGLGGVGAGRRWHVYGSVVCRHDGPVPPGV